MPRDSVFSTGVERLPTGEPVTLYLPPGVRWSDVLTLDKLPSGAARWTVRDDRSNDDRPNADRPNADGSSRDGQTRTVTTDGVEDAAALVDGQHCLSVGWHRGGGYVQVGPGARAHDGSELRVPGRWVDLDWYGTNRLVRFLRTARDQAFGRPE
jgi:hypothetical protein